jgi:hypothetical protein
MIEAVDISVDPRQGGLWITMWIRKGAICNELGNLTRALPSGAERDTSTKGSADWRASRATNGARLCPTDSVWKGP